ncbi:MAG: molybdenum cofactor guanylyltransferase MobA [Gammaproteobacteria bacterium]|nr:molybdenum cofactor guanylyltransferase MobA [Gammaproteobacteria bacterium]
MTRDSTNGITALVLAGGRGRRMGGRDKGLVELRGRPLVAHVVEAIAPQVEKVLINANRNRDRYAAFGWPVVSDALTDYQGPLAGFAVGMAASHTPLLLTLPCDGPMVAPDLAARLAVALEGSGADIAVAHDGTRMQPVYALIRCALLPSLEAFLAAGDRKIDLWYERHHTVSADFSHFPEQFTNVNTPEERARLEGAAPDGATIPGAGHGAD